MLLWLFLRGTQGPPVGGQGWRTSAPNEVLDWMLCHSHVYFIHLSILRLTVPGWVALNKYLSDEYEGWKGSSKPTDVDQTSHFLVNWSPWRFLGRSSDHFLFLLQCTFSSVTLSLWVQRQFPHSAFNSSPNKVAVFFINYEINATFTSAGWFSLDIPLWMPKAGDQQSFQCIMSVRLEACQS